MLVAILAVYSACDAYYTIENTKVKTCSCLNVLLILYTMYCFRTLQTWCDDDAEISLSFTLSMSGSFRFNYILRSKLTFNATLEYVWLQLA